MGVVGKWNKILQKQRLYDELKGEWDIHTVDYLVLRLMTLMDILVIILMDLVVFMKTWCMSEKF